MHFHLPKPLHGWRAFAGEVGVIVLGVLIALGAQQVVEAQHWRSEAAEFRKAVNIEMADSLAAYRYRVEQEPCVQRRLSELHLWVAAERAGTAMIANGDIGRPSLYTFRTTVWKSSSPDMMNHLTMDARQTYSALYDQLDNVDGEFNDEAEVWRNLNAFNGASRLDPDSRRRLSELIYRAKSVDDLITANFTILMSDAAAAGIRPDFGEREKHIEPPDPEFCRPLFAST